MSDPHISKSELVEAAYGMTGGNVKDLSLDQLLKLMTVTNMSPICVSTKLSIAES
jgi:hypothetical protein